MKRRSVAVLHFGAVFVATLGACEPVETEGVLLSCESDDECPVAQVCDANNLCNPPRTDVVIEPVAVVSSTATPPLVGRPFIEAGEPLVVAIVLSKPTTTTPRVRLMNGTDVVGTADAAVTVAADVDNSWTAQFILNGGEPEGVLRVVVDVVDDAVDADTVVERETTSTVTTDFTGPLPVAASLQRLPDPRRTIVALEILGEDDVGPAVDVRLVFSTSEPVFVDGDQLDASAGVVALDDTRAPVVATLSAAAVLGFARDRRSTNPLIYDLQWPDDVDASAYDGNHEISVRLTDLAGNEATTTLQLDENVDTAGFIVDGTAPAPPTVDVAETVVFERAPWGRLDVDQADLYRVIGAAGSVEPGAIVLITRDDSLGLELDRVVAEDDGSFAAPDDGSKGLSIADIETLYVRVADAAGNVGEVVAVRDVHWLATSLGKIAGSTLENPHAVHAAPIFAAHLEQNGLTELDELQDGAAPTVGAGTWRFVDDPLISLKSGSGRLTADATIATDPLRGLTMLIGRRVSNISNDGTGFVGEASCGAFASDVKIRGSDGRWRGGPPLPTSFTTQFSPPKAVWAGSLGRIILVGDQLRIASFDGIAWRDECGDNCGAALPAFDRTPTSIVWDERRAVAVAVVGSTVAELDFTQRPLQWQPVETVLPRPMQALWDEENDVVIFAGGAQLLSWDGRALVDVCTGACAQTAPPARSGAIVVRDEQHDQFVLFGGAGDVPCEIATSNAVIESTRAQQQHPDDGIVIAPSATPGPTETWTFDGTAWTRHDVAGPGARTRHAMSWDPLRRRVLLAGGDDCNCMAQRREGLEGVIVEGFPDDTWEWNGAAWSRIFDPEPVPSTFTRTTTKPALRDHSVVEAMGGAVVYGARSLHLFKDDAWHTHTNSAADSERLSLLSFQPAVAASPTGTIIAVGGAFVPRPPQPVIIVTGPPPFPSTFTNGVIARICADRGPCTPPTNFWGAAAWHDGERFFVHGGVDRDFETEPFGSGPAVPGNANNGTLRAFGGTSWTTLCEAGPCASTRPSGRLLHRVVLDGDGRAVMFGGIVQGTETSNETWVWDGTTETWTQLAGAAPPARAAHVLAWDAERDVVVVAYGTDAGAAPVDATRSLPPIAHAIPEALSEVWELHGDVWAPAPHVDLEGDGRPSARSSVAGSGLVSGGVLLFGGTPSPSSTIAEISDFLAPTPRSNEAWIWHGGADDVPGYRFSVRADERLSLLRADDVLTGLVFTWHARGGRTNLTGPVDPPRLVWWDGSGWIDVDNDDRLDCGDGCFSARLSGPEARRALVNSPNKQLSVGVVAPAANGQAPGRAVITSSNVELQLHWRRPATP